MWEAMDIIAVQFIVKGSTLNVSDCIDIARAMQSFIERGDITALRSVLDYYYSKSFITMGTYYELIEHAQIERYERIVRK